MEKQKDTNRFLWKQMDYLLQWVCHSLGKYLSKQRTLPPIRLAPLAVLIDGENMSSEFIAPILLEAEKFGRVTVRRVYGNWSQPSMVSWQAILFHYSLTPMHLPATAAKKNAADIALAVDAMDLFHAGMTHFCLVTSDSDFTPLVRRLRDAGCFLLGIGKPETLSTLKKPCSVFVSTEELLPSAARAKSPDQSAGSLPSAPATALAATGASPSASTSTNGASVPHQEPIPSQLPSVDAHVIAVLTNAYQAARKAGRDEWVLTQQLGTFLKQLEPTFDYRVYGCKKLSSLIQKYPEQFQTQTQNNGHVAFRLQSPPATK